MKVAEFDYDLPADLIAQYPTERREHSRLMVLDRASATWAHTTFARLPEFLNPDDVLVVNDTKVIPARLLGHKKATGGKIEIFLLRQQTDSVWDVLIGGKVKPGTQIVFEQSPLTCIVHEKGPSGKGVVEFAAEGDLKEALYATGSIPLPPYIKRPDGVLPADHARYQTVYAEREGAVAAPTAGLHFSEALLSEIQQQGIAVTRVTLHVGIGTFQPVKTDDVEAHRIMAEYYEFSEQSAHMLSRAMAEGRRIVAVGTTTTRLLESVYQQHQTLRAGSGWAGIYIYPGFQFQVVQALITNFHLPKSSLLMLVSAFGGMELIRNAYQDAIAQHYRFYSYGDAMLIV